MKKLLVISLFTSLTSQSFAQDCGDVKDGTVSRLDSPGRSLEHARVQDQDGLGTCYANTASLMMQSSLPNHPEVSYLHLAINRAERLVNKDLKAQGKNQAFKENGDMLLDAGFSCESIKLAKEAGGVCDRSDVALEKMIFNPDASQYLDPEWVQLDLLKKVSTYYDGMLRDFTDAQNTHQPFSFGKKKSRAGSSSGEEKMAPGSFFSRLFGIDEDPNRNVNENVKAIGKDDEKAPSNTPDATKFERYKEALKKVIDSKRDDYAKKVCEKLDTTNSQRVSSNIVLRLFQKLQKHDVLDPVYQQYSQLKSKMGNPYSYEHVGATFYNPNLSESFVKSLEDNYLKSLTSSEPPESAKEALRKSLIKMAGFNVNKAIDEVMNQLSPDDLKLLDSDYKRYTKKDFSECLAQGKIDFMKNDDGLIKEYTGVGCTQEFYKHVKNLQQMVLALDKHNFDNIDRLNDFISNLPNLSYDQAMMRLLAPTCSEEKKIKLPQDLSCWSKTVSYPGSKDDDEATTARHLTRMKKDFLSTTLDSLKEDKAIGLSMCTGFYNSTETNEFYNKTGLCDRTKKHGFHAVSMIGYKCVKGKVKYLIQNSWGNWENAEPKFEKDSHGKVWMDEDDLVKNTYQMDIMD